MLKHNPLQILISCIIPHSGAWIIYALIFRKIEERHNSGQIEPFYAPPSWLVLTAWAIIFTLIGYASWRVWSVGEGFAGKAKIPLIIYTFQLVLNWIWVIIAFSWNFLLGAIVAMCFLLLLVTLTGILFYKIDKAAGFLFLPYIGYLSYATVLCIHIYILNN